MLFNLRSRDIACALSGHALMKADTECNITNEMHRDAPQCHRRVHQQAAALSASVSWSAAVAVLCLPAASSRMQLQTLQHEHRVISANLVPLCIDAASLSVQSEIITRCSKARSSPGSSAGASSCASSAAARLLAHRCWRCVRRPRSDRAARAAAGSWSASFSPRASPLRCRACAQPDSVRGEGRPWPSDRA